MKFPISFLLGILVSSEVAAWQPSFPRKLTANHVVSPTQDIGMASKTSSSKLSEFKSITLGASLMFLSTVLMASPTWAEGQSEFKINAGGASTMQTGRTISITRGVNLDNSNFRGQNLKGVAFQQSIVRDCDFKGANLVGASFFDATLDGSDFEGADMTMANVEMAQFNRSSLKNAVLKEVYVSGATIFTGVKDIEGSDWSDTYLRPDQRKYLCSHPTAKGTNPVTGVETRESLMCTD